MIVLQAEPQIWHQDVGITVQAMGSRWCHNMPVASERTPISVGLTCRYSFSPGCSPVWATRWMLQHSVLTTQPTCWHCQRRAGVGTPANQGHLLASSHSRTPLLAGPVLAGPQGPPLQL